MSVTRQQLRQMILDEAVELTPIEPTRPGEAFQALAAANISGQYNEKLTQFTSDLIASVGESEAARTIENLASAGMLRTLATMDTSEWEVIMTALSESANLTATQVCQLISEIADPSGHDSTLMTLGQFRRLVREAARGSRPVPLNEIEEVPYAAINGLLQALNRHGPWESTGKMEDAVADALTISQWVTDAADGYAKRHEVNASDLLDDLRSELNDRGSRGPGLDKVSITDYTPPDPHPSEELYQAEGSLDDDIEEISDRLDRQMGHESYQDFADELQLIRTGNMTFADRRQHLTRLELDMSTEGID